MRRAGLLLAGLLALIGGCAGSPRDLPAKPPQPALTCGEATPLAELERNAREPGAADDAIALLDTGRQAFLFRVALIEAATCAIDAQYYIWNSDDSGRYMAARLLAAADRGVRVRLLLDDINSGGRDGVLAALDQHPNVEIQIYNPTLERKGLARGFDFLREFTRINRRMHNKSFTVDGVATVLGGRNIGDEYFDADLELNFRDRDVAVLGPVAARTAAMFDDFWNSPLARPIAELAPTPTPLDPLEAARLVDAATGRMNYLHGPLPADAQRALEWLGIELAQAIRAPARLVYDPPPELRSIGQTDLPQPSSEALRAVAEQARSEVLIESAYLVLDAATLEQAGLYAARGVRYRALTNSLASNDVTANHAAYARTRRAILAAGIDLYEFRPDAASCRKLVQNHAPCAVPQKFGLHAKTFVMDRQVVYVGSLNLNLRSRYLNAESGLIIESVELAERIAADIEENMRPGNSWKPELDGRRVRWIEDFEAEVPRVVYVHEPREGRGRRLRSAIIASLPLEKYL